MKNNQQKVTAKPGWCILVQDDSCHWYVIPEHKRNHWCDWVDDEENDDLPGYALEVGGSPSLVKFREFEAWV